jgi:hypothetical protein
MRLRRRGRGQLVKRLKRLEQRVEHFAMAHPVRWGIIAAVLILRSSL